MHHLFFFVHLPNIISHGCICDAWILPRVILCYTPQSAVVPPYVVRLIEVSVSFAFFHL